MAAAGQRHEERDYSVVDEKVFDPCELRSATFYYRLKMVDLDRTFECSDVGEVSFKSKSGLMVGEVYPYPASRQMSTINIPVFIESPSDMVITFFDVRGRTVGLFERDIQNGNNVVQLELGQFSVGAYYLKMTSGNIVLNKKFIVQ